MELIVELFVILFVTLLVTIVFSSSTHAETNTTYGLCKAECEQMIQNWCQQYGGKFYNLRIPNVFGPFCKTNYNSFIATFCYIYLNELTGIFSMARVFKSKRV